MGKRLEEYKEAALIIRLKRRQTTIPKFWIDDWSVLELEYYTIADISSTSVLEVVTNQERQRIS